MKNLLLLLLLFLVTFPAHAKEKAVQTHQNLFQTCPVEDPACAEVQEMPKAQTAFETLQFERVIDGDTFVANKRRIRVWGINAPEKNEPAFTASGWLLQALMKDGTLTCKLVDIDKYKREVMHCLIDGLDIAAMMVKMGMARDYAKYSGGYYQQEQTQAKAKNRGIWKLPEAP